MKLQPKKIAATTGLALALFAGPAVLSVSAIAQAAPSDSTSDYYGVPGNPNATNGDLDAAR